MADLTRIREPLEIAAASPDPVVRAMAQRYMEMKRELAVLDPLFALYARESAAIEARPHAAAKGNGKVAVAMPLPPLPSDAAKAAAFDAAVRAALAERGPLPLDELHAEFERRNPGDGRNRDALRVALQSRRWVVRVSEKDRRYRLADGAAGGADAARVAA